MKKLLFQLLFFISFLIAAFSCESPRGPHYYTIEGSKSAMNYASFRGQDEDSLPVTPVIPALAGDLIVGEEFFLKAEGRRDKTLVFSDSAKYLTLGGQMYAVKISELSGNFPELSNKELDHLGFLNVDELPTEVQFSMLEKIATHNRNISIYYSDMESDTTNEVNEQILERLLTLFDPPILSCFVNEKNAAFIAKEKKLEVLMLSMDDSSGFILPNMPALKSLIFIEDSLRNNFLKYNPQLENLSIFSKSSVDTSILGGLPDLRSLRFPFSGTLNLQPISKMKKLDRLILEGDSIINLAALQELKLLRWLHLPDETSQDQFDSVISFNQKLELLEINGGVHINDLSRLNNCKSLKGLVFYGDTMTAKKGLNKLTNLKYLSLPEDSFSDTAYLALMKKNFPNTTIVPNSGVCLGSGWILLLIPLVLIFKFVYRDKIVAA